MADRYFISVGTAWNDTANWSDSPGGAGGASVPGVGDNAYFDASSGNCTLTAHARCENLDTTGYTGTLDLSTYRLEVDVVFTNGASATVTNGTWPSLLVGTSAGGGTVDNSAGGTISVNHLELKYGGIAISEGTYDCGLHKFRNAGAATTLTMGRPGNTSPIVFNGNVEFEVTSGLGTLRVECSVYNLPIQITGSLEFDDVNVGGLTYTKGTGSIQLTGNAAQTIQTPLGWTASGTQNQLEKITINKDGGEVVFASNAGEIYTEGLDFAANTGCTVFLRNNPIYLGDQGLDSTSGGNYTLECESATITCSGDFNNNFVGTWTWGISTVVLTGASKNIWSNNAQDFYNLTISGSYTTLGAVDVNGDFDLSNGELVVQHIVRLMAAKTLTLTSATVSGSSSIIIPNTGSTITGEPTSYNLATTIRRECTFNATGTFGGSWIVENNASVSYGITFGAGARTFTGNIQFRTTATGGYDVDTSAATVNLTFQGNVTISESSGSITWTKGTGSIQLTGNNPSQTVTLPAAWSGAAGQRLEATTVNKSAGGRVTLASDYFTDGFLGTDGDFDLATFKLDSAGDISADKTTGFRFWNGTDYNMQGGTLVTADGSLLALVGSDGDLLNLENINMSVGDTTTFNVDWCSVTNCPSDNPNNQIIATNSFNGGGNDNWNFGAVEIVWSPPDASTDPAVPANWVGGVAPTSADVAVFDGSSSNNDCTLTGQTEWAGVRYDNNYAGTLSLVTHFLLLGEEGYDASANATAAGLSFGLATLICQGDFLFDSLGNITIGTGKLALTGSVDSLLRGNAQLLPDLEVFKDAVTHYVRAGSNLSIGRVNTIDGSLDVNGQTITCRNELTIGNNSGFRFHNGINEDMAGGSFAILAGALSMAGNVSQDLVINNLDFAMSPGVAGTATGYTSVQNSTATGDADIDATDGTNKNLGGNVGWNFSTPPVTPQENAIMFGCHF